MTERPLIPQSVVANLENLGVRAHNTKLALRNGGSFMVWGRWNDDLERHVKVGERYVVLEFRAERPNRQGSISAEVSIFDGTIETLYPFDVEVGDTFTAVIGTDTLSGTVVLVAPPKLGVIKITFSINTGDR